MQNEVIKTEKIKECPFTKAACGKAQCALYVYNRSTEKGICAFAAIAENTRGIDSGAHGIWGELRDRY